MVHSLIIDTLLPRYIGNTSSQLQSDSQAHATRKVTQTRSAARVHVALVPHRGVMKLVGHLGFAAEPACSLYASPIMAASQASSLETETTPWTLGCSSAFIIRLEVAHGMGLDAMVWWMAPLAGTFMTSTAPE